MQKRRREIITALMAGLAIVLLDVSEAWADLEYPAPFKIGEVVAANKDNMHFRVVSTAPDAHCYNGPANLGWSFVDGADPGAKTKMSALLAAYLTGKTVAVTTQGVDINDGHYCQIIEVSVRN